MERYDNHFNAPGHYASDPAALENCMARDGGVSISSFCNCRSKGRLPQVFGDGCRGLVSVTESGFSARRGCRFYRAHSVTR